LNVSSARGDGSGAHDVPMSMYIILYIVCNMLCRYSIYIYVHMIIINGLVYFRFDRRSLVQVQAITSSYLQHTHTPLRTNRQIEYEEHYNDKISNRRSYRRI